MLSERFLGLYNEELRYLRECGMQFAERHPQVARHLGMHKDGVQDPFVERLLEGSAFLSARVHERIENEYPEFALQMLERLAPYWHTPMPSIATIGLTPDFTSPLWQAPVVLPKGSKVTLSDTSLRNKNATFVTGRELAIQPVAISMAECSASLAAELPEAVTRHLNSAQSCLRLRLTTQGVKPLSQTTFDPLHLTLTGSAVRANQLLTALTNGCQKVVLWARQAAGPLVTVLDKSQLRQGGLSEEEALLPQGIGELPGSRLMREFFAAPSRFYSVDLHGINDFLARCGQQQECELLFALDAANPQLLEQVSTKDFHLFATPVINLYSRRCDPVQLDKQRTEHHIVVDRLNPALYEVHHLQSVQGLTRSTEAVTFSRLPEDVAFGHGQPRAGYAVRRCSSPQPQSAGRSLFGDDDLFITLSPGATETQLDEISSLSVSAMVCDRFFLPDQLQQPMLQISLALPLTSISLLRMPSAPRPVPEIRQAWQAIGRVTVNPLRYMAPEVKDAAPLIRNWLSLFATTAQASQRRCISSIESATFTASFERDTRPGPMTWTRGVKACINLCSENHADQGGLLFGRLLHSALSDYCQLNQTLRTVLLMDGEPFAEWEPSHDF
jgi:type VI secretion system protein ImpG